MAPDLTNDLANDAAALPAAVETYLATPKDELGPILGEVFAADAVVHDEGNTHVGIDAIRAWSDAVAAAFSFTREVVSGVVRGGAVVVRVDVRGDFFGSPVELHHHFSIADGKITALTICP
ncbi:nuclear transport factor 2 family protein [Actinopolymorpha pittospori]